MIRNLFLSFSKVPNSALRRSKVCWGKTSNFSSLTATEAKGVRILYASQGGTAQLFAQQLAEEIESLNSESSSETDVTIEGWHEYPEKTPSKLLQPGKGLHVFLASVTGVGDPPDNGRQFYEWLATEKEASEKNSLNDLEFTVFGLGNSKAHPKHYNVIGIDVDKRLESLGASRIYPLGLGDDGDCLEDDFDTWMEGLVEWIQDRGASNTDKMEDAATEQNNEIEGVLEKDDSIATSTQTIETVSVSCPSEVTKSGDSVRMASVKYPQLELLPPKARVVRHDLFHLEGTEDQFYRQGAVKAHVQRSRSLSAYGGEAGLREIIVSHPDIDYETGDHLLVYPRNSDSLVNAYLDLLDISPHAIIQKTCDESDTYPHPKSLTVQETLSHCVDLGAIPSPAVCRYLLGQKDIDYKTEIAYPRRTVLDLLLENGGRSISVEDLMYSLTPLKGRYYSISSSPASSNPHEVRLTYRPVKYVTSRGAMREGLCTSYLSTMAGVRDGSIKSQAGAFPEQCISVAINSNPAFRLPTDPSTPVLLIAGGCGVAPIRAFTEERLSLKHGGSNLGPCHVYLGFRSPEDEVYRGLMEEAVQEGALSGFKVSYSVGSSSQPCLNVNELVRTETDLVWNHLEQGGVTYLCGGARSFGAAIYQELLDIICEKKPTDLQGAEVYLRTLLDEGRLLEDLAD